MHDVETLVIRIDFFHVSYNTKVTLKAQKDRTMGTLISFHIFTLMNAYCIKNCSSKKIKNKPQKKLT